MKVIRKQVRRLFVITPHYIKPIFLSENKPKKSMEKSIINKGKTLKRSMSLRTPKETRYSSTSTSSFEAEDVRVAVQSEIYYDNKQMPRIETVRSLKSYFKNNEHKVKKSK